MKPWLLATYAAVNKPINALGLELTLKRKASAFLNKRLENIRKLGFSPNVIYDCGAYTGEWTLTVSKIFPGAQFVLMEPNKSILEKIRATSGRINPSPIVLDVGIGEKPGTALLNVWGSDKRSAAGSSFLDHVEGEADRKIETEILTLDLIFEKTGLKPDLVKLDLQGAELSALLGGEQVLKSAELFIIEFGCLEAYHKRTTPKELMDIMYDNDYTLYDVVDLIYRPYDNAFVGGDFFFVKKGSALKKYKGYA